MNSLSARVLIVSALVLSVVGVIDSLISREWDLLALFILVTLVHVVMLLLQGAHRRNTTIRPDLARWIEHRSQTTGEPSDYVLDRAIASYKHGLYGSDGELD